MFFYYVGLQNPRATTTKQYMIKTRCKMLHTLYITQLNKLIHQYQ